MPKGFVWRHIIITVFLSIIVCGALLFQYPSERRFTLFFLNKAVGQTAVILIGLSFLLGPLCKIFHFLSHHIQYRKYFGLFGFGFVVLHIVFSLLQWPDRFNLQWYIDHLVGIIAAIIAMLIFTVLAFTSRASIMHSLGGPRWKMIQRTGYIAVVLVLIHIYIASSLRWQQWFAGEVSMPTSLLIFVFGIVVIVARLIALLWDKHNAVNQAEDAAKSYTSVLSTKGGSVSDQKTLKP